MTLLLEMTKSVNWKMKDAGILRKRGRYVTMDSKKLFLLIAVIGLIPLLIIFIFLFYRIKLRKESSPLLLKSRVENTSLSSEWIQSSKAVLQNLAEHPLLKKYLDHTSRSSSQGETPEQSGGEEELSGYIEEFRSLHPEFEKIILKNPQTGNVYLKMPAGEGGEDLPGICLLVAIPVSGTEDTTQALLQGFVNVDLFPLPQKESKQESPVRGKRKLAMIFVWLFLFLVIIIPFIMFMIYRQMNKMLDAQLPNQPSPPKPPWEINNTKDSQGKR